MNGRFFFFYNAVSELFLFISSTIKTHEDIPLLIYRALRRNRDCIFFSPLLWPATVKFCVICCNEKYYLHLHEINKTKIGIDIHKLEQKKNNTSSMHFYGLNFCLVLIHYLTTSGVSWYFYCAMQITSKNALKATPLA